MVSTAIHHLSLGTYITIKNARSPSPHINNIDNYPETFYHGTTCCALQRGILRHGIQPTIGAGA